MNRKLYITWCCWLNEIMIITSLFEVYLSYFRCKVSFALVWFLLVFVEFIPCYSLRFGAFILYSDGAAALVLVSGEKALQLGLQVIAKVKGFADAAQVLFNNSSLPLAVSETLLLKEDCLSRHLNFSRLPQPSRYQKPSQMLVWMLLKSIITK